MDSGRNLTKQETKEELTNFLTRRGQKVSGEFPLLPAAQGDRKDLERPTATKIEVLQRWGRKL